MQTELTLKLKWKARSLGFNKVGVIIAHPARRLEAYHRWLDNQYHGAMDWMARSDRVARRDDPEVILPGVKSIVVVGLDYWTGAAPEIIVNDPSRGRFSNYSWAVDYHDIMEPRLSQLASWLEGLGGNEVEQKVYVDTGAILERDHGESAGLGFTGKNTMLINPKAGSWFFLGELLTTAEIVPDEPKVTMLSCGTCSRCLTACPTDAFPAPYVLDARRCISYLTIEHKGWIPRELRPLMGNWVYGCDVCQEVCPFNRFATPTGEEEFYAASWDRAAPKLVDLLSLDQAEFMAKFEGTSVKRIGRARLVRNSCIAAGNWGSDEAVELLLRLMSDPEAIVRGHAAWALGRIGASRSRMALNRAHANDDNRQVQSEIEDALARLA